jgi:hypothetical protein
MGHGWVNAIAKEDRERVGDGWHTAIDEDREFDLEFNFATPEGTIIPAHVRSYKMKDGNNKTVGYLGSVTLL